jgi:hypothetical protein
VERGGLRIERSKLLMERGGLLMERAGLLVGSWKSPFGCLYTLSRRLPPSVRKLSSSSAKARIYRRERKMKFNDNEAARAQQLNAMNTKA